MTRANLATADVGQREILTQQGVLGYFDEALDYDYLGNWKDRDGNRNVGEELLRSAARTCSSPWSSPSRTTLAWPSTPLMSRVWRGCRRTA